MMIALITGLWARIITGLAIEPPAGVWHPGDLRGAFLLCPVTAAWEDDLATQSRYVVC